MGTAWVVEDVCEDDDTDYNRSDGAKSVSHAAGTRGTAEDAGVRAISDH